MSYQGGCQCGAIRYTIRAGSMFAYACHCTACQKQSSSAFGMSMVVPSDAFTIDKGQPGTFIRTSASGRKGLCLFCPSCGSRIVHKAIAGDHPSVVVKPGTLDDTSGLVARAHLWTRHAQPWTASLRAGAPSFEEQPDEFGQLVRDWQAGAERGDMSDSSPSDDRT